MTVKVSKQNGVAHVSFDSPPLNLLSDEVKSEITETFRAIAKDNSVRVTLFYTCGEHFCCGANLKEFPARIENKAAREVWMQGHEMLSSIMDIPQPTIAYVKGNALGGGAELASAFDIRIFSSDVKIGYPEVLRGVFPGNGGLERLISLVGQGNAMNLVLTGKLISSEVALRYGLASELVSSEFGMNMAEKLAQSMSNLSGVTLKIIKRAIKEYTADPLTFLDRGKELFYLAHETEDVKEAVSAFFEKRKPSFIHR